jgi:20S proteasome subunit beta 6
MATLAANPLRLAAAPKPEDAAAANGQQPMQARFYPYDYNGGTVLAVAGKNFSIVAGDTRMSTGFNIKSRSVSKIFQINSKTVLGTGGFRGDITTLQ